MKMKQMKKKIMKIMKIMKMMKMMKMTDPIVIQGLEIEVPGPDWESDVSKGAKKKLMQRTWTSAALPEVLPHEMKKGSEAMACD